jgi:hypothetical protein
MSQVGELSDIYKFVRGTYGTDGETFGVLAFSLIALGLVAVGLYSMKRREERRRDGLELAAKNMGWDFLCQQMPWHAWSKEKHFTVPEQAKRPFSFFSTEGVNRSFDYIAQGAVDGSKVLICQYEYFTGAGKNQTRHVHAICIMDKDGLSLPRFVVRRKERSFDWFLRLLPTRLVDRDDHPEFSKYFYWQSNPSSAEKVLSKDLPEFITAHRSTIAWFECMGPAILVDVGRALQPEEFSAFLDVSSQLLHRVERSRTG